MEIIEKIQDDINIYRLIGRLDTNTSARFEQKLFQTISGGSKKMIVDFKDLNYISSAGIRLIFIAYKALMREDGRIILCSMQKYVREIFKMTGIDSFVPILDNMDEALKAFGLSGTVSPIDDPNKLL